MKNQGSNALEAAGTETGGSEMSGLLELAEKGIDASRAAGVSRSTRTTLRLLLYLVGCGVFIAVVSVSLTFAFIGWHDARVLKLDRPIRLGLAEQSAVIDHVFDHVEGDAAARDHRVPHSIDKIKKAARENALKQERNGTVDASDNSQGD